MSPEELKAKDRRVTEAMNQRNLAVFDELCAPDMVVHSANMTTQGVEAYKQALSQAFTAFPDLQFTIEDQLAEEDKSVIRFTESGTHQGDLMGIPATGKQYHGTGISIVRHDANGKTAEVWINSDDLGMLQQLGVVPAPGQAS
jgi:steroid delta-isomerase-like uncharacterized protein